MAYLTEEMFYLKEMSTIFMESFLFDDSFISAVNCKLVEAVLFIFRVHLPMRRRKKKAEEQAYKNAKDAILG